MGNQLVYGKGAGRPFGGNKIHYGVPLKYVRSQASYNSWSSYSYTQPSYTYPKTTSITITHSSPSTSTYIVVN